MTGTELGLAIVSLTQQINQLAAALVYAEKEGQRRTEVNERLANAIEALTELLRECKEGKSDE